MRREKRINLLNLLDHDKCNKALDIDTRTGKIEKLDLYREYTLVVKGLPKHFHPRYGHTNSQHQKDVMKKIMTNNNPMSLEENKKYGKDNPNYGVPSPHRKAVTYKSIDYPSIRHMALSINKSRAMCRIYLRKEV